MNETESCDQDEVETMMSCNSSDYANWTIWNFSTFSPTCVVEIFLERNEQSMRQLVLNDYMLALGLFLVLQYHLTLFVPEKWWGICRRYGPGSSALRLLGRNLVVLVLYYAEVMWFGPLQNPLFDSLGFIFVDTVLFYYTFKQIAKCMRFTVPAPHLPLEFIMTRYTDFSIGARTAAAIFFVQFCLLLLFVMYLNDDPLTHARCNVVIFQWLIGVVLTNIAGSDETGVPFSWVIWDKIRTEWDEAAKSADVEEYINNHPHADSEPPRLPGEPEIRLRMAFDFIINSLCREVLLGLAPVVLSTAGRWDFVKDCLAIFFISRLDDLDDAKSLPQSIKGWIDRNSKEDPDHHEGNAIRNRHTYAAVARVDGTERSSILWCA